LKAGAILLFGVLALGGGASWYFLSRTAASTAAAAPEVPSTAVRRGDVRISVVAKGELQGGNSEMLIAPMTGGREMAITFLRESGEVVEPNDIIVQFDTTEQEFALREAEADLAEAEQQVIQAQAENEAREEEGRHALVSARAQVKLTELEARKNPLLAAIAARQNELALEAARDRLRQFEADVANRLATSRANLAIQEAARVKARVKAETAKRNIASMTLRAKSRGYVAVQQNSNTNFAFLGMQLPIFQTGDTVRAGMAVAQIPDMDNWEVSARLGELDRGHLSIGQNAEIRVVALPDQTLTGRIKNIGGTAGPPWDRHFECRLAIEDPILELRPGMSARIVITTGVIENALWVPSQALFESDGRSFVYAWKDGGFLPVDVKLVRRSESQVVVEGLQEGWEVALASPEERRGKKGAGGVMQAVPKL
jgi:HlyD family secretion protein